MHILCEDMQAMWQEGNGAPEGNGALEGNGAPEIFVFSTIPS